MNASGYCIVGGAKKGGTELIAVVLKSPKDLERYQDVRNMLHWGYANFHSVKLMARGASAGRVWIRNGHSTYVKTCVPSGAYLTLSNDADTNIATKKIVMKKGLTAPLKKGAVVGTVKLYEDGTKVSQKDVVLTRDVEKGGPWSMIYISDMCAVFIALAIVILAIFIAISRGKRKKRRRMHEQAMMKARQEKAREIAMRRADKDRRGWPY